MPDSESVKNINVPNSPLWKLIHLRRLDSNGSGLFYWRPTRFFTAFQCCCILLVLVLPIPALRLNLPPPVYAGVVCLIALLLFLVLPYAREFLLPDSLDLNRKLVTVRGKAIPFAEISGIQILRSGTPCRFRCGGMKAYCELNIRLRDGGRIFLCNCHPSREKELEKEAEILRNLLGVPCSFSFY